MFEAQTIFDKIPTPEGGKALICQPLKIDWTFYCYKCDGMASLRTCPHGKEDRVLLSGTILRAYYEGLTDKVEIKTHKTAMGD